MIYTGFVLIMLSFFILLTSFASLQEAKISRFARSFSSAMSVFQRGKNPTPGKIQHQTDISIVSKEDLTARLFERIRVLGSYYNLDSMDIRISERGVILTLAETLLFASGDTQLDARAEPLLEKIGAIISRVDAPVEIEGHTDNVPIRTEAFPSNWELSTARAINVLRFLVRKFELDPKRIAASGRSQYHPLAPNNTPQNRAVNRRVEFVFGIDGRDRLQNQ